ncbi:MAG: DNA repair protein RecN [Candidatus Dormibacteraeota bacterium]|nr:DNA repair protein RecN [Candidatus Dormibacteraeota bacterium]
MLAQLEVQELALIQRACVQFGQGLNLLTGETGSGKSLLVDALALALGGRASQDQIREGAERATVAALFLRPAGRLRLSREVGRRSAARLDGRVSSPAQLRELGSRLVGVHGQHDQQLLLEPQTQTQLLDEFAGAQEPRITVAAAYTAWLQALTALQELEAIATRSRQDEEYLRWQLNQLHSANPRPGEDEELSAERAAARHAVRLAELVGDAGQTLRTDASLAAAVGALRSAAELDSRLAALPERLALLTEEVGEIGSELRHYLDSLNNNPRRLAEIEDRLAVLEQLKRRYNGSLEAAIEERARLETQLAEAGDLGPRLNLARATVAARRAELEAAAGTLTDARTEASARLTQAVAAELKGLRLEDARFEIQLAGRPELGAEGAEQAEMLFAANPGEPLGPLARVASGGELSRVMLALRTAAAEADRLPTLVFDEVDAGIGGEAARQVGLRLQRLGRRHQVLVVTHLAQIACYADHHLVVEKTLGGSGRNVVQVRELKSGAERAAELARMMSGGVTEKALARARELIDEARPG